MSVSSVTKYLIPTTTTTTTTHPSKPTYPRENHGISTNDHRITLWA